MITSPVLQLVVTEAVSQSKTARLTSILTIPGKDFSLGSHTSVDMRFSEAAVSGALETPRGLQACLPPAVECPVADPHTALVGHGSPEHQTAIMSLNILNPWHRVRTSANAPV